MRRPKHDRRGGTHRDRRRRDRGALVSRNRGRSGADVAAIDHSDFVRGDGQGIEARVLPREGFELDFLRSGGIKGKSIGARVAARRSCRSV
jgi:hypothetical protein